MGLTVSYLTQVYIYCIIQHTINSQPGPIQPVNSEIWAPKQMNHEDWPTRSRQRVKAPM